MNLVNQLKNDLYNYLEKSDTIENIFNNINELDDINLFVDNEIININYNILVEYDKIYNYLKKDLDNCKEINIDYYLTLIQNLNFYIDFDKDCHKRLYFYTLLISSPNFDIKKYDNIKSYKNIKTYEDLKKYGNIKDINTLYYLISAYYVKYINCIEDFTFLEFIVTEDYYTVYNFSNIFLAAFYLYKPDQYLPLKISNLLNKVIDVSLLFTNPIYIDSDIILLSFQNFYYPLLYIENISEDIIKKIYIGDESKFLSYILRIYNEYKLFVKLETLLSNFKYLFKILCKIYPKKAKIILDDFKNTLDFLDINKSDILDINKVKLEFFYENMVFYYKYPYGIKKSARKIY